MTTAATPVTSSSTQTQTLPGLLLERGRAYPKDVAFREKDGGIWRATTWSDYCVRVEGIAYGFASIGVRRRDTVGIIGDNRPEWVCCELAAQALGAIPLGVYQDATSEELASLVGAGRVRLLVVEDQEQVDKVLEVWSRLSPRPLRLVYWDPRGLDSYRSSRTELELEPLTELVRAGVGMREREPEYFERSIGALTADDVALLATTSGTTGTPKLAMLTHRNMLSMARNLARVDPIAANDELVSFLPLPWVGEQMMVVASSLAIGATVNFPEEPETATRDLREIAPSVTFAPPRIWEGLLSEVEMKHEDASALKKRVLRWALRVGAETAPDSNESLPLGARLRRALAEAAGLYWIRDALGLLRLRRAYTGGAPLGPDVVRFFHSIGVNLKQIYGQTEVAGIAVVHRDGDVTAESVGLPIPETSVRIAESGEILLRSPAVFEGYFGNDDATKAALRDGWLHTGDAGYFDERGHLVVVDRASDVSKLSDGTSFSPQFVENRLKFSSHVREAVVFGGEGRPFVAAIVVIDFDNVSLWAERRSLSFSTFTDLSQKHEVIELITRHVSGTNGKLPESMRVRRFLLLHKELDADDQELTRTRKVRRGFVEQRYRVLVDALYGDVDTAEVETQVVYQDGRTAQVSERVRLVTLPVENVGDKRE
jgi:long-chain acyl-CoA synthetase